MFGGKAAAVVNPTGYIAGKVGGTAGKLIDPHQAFIDEQSGKNDKEAAKKTAKKKAQKAPKKVDGLLDDTTSSSLL